MGQEDRPRGDQLVQGGRLAARFGHREHHLAPHLKLGDAWGDDLNGGSQPDVEDAPSRLDPQCLDALKQNASERNSTDKKKAKAASK